MRQEVTAVHKHMYKSWIQENPEIALASVTKFLEEATAAGMMLRYHESEHYVDIVAARSEKYLEGWYA